MVAWICLKCRRVFHTINPNCCGECAIFSPEIHGESLVGLSNSWIMVWKEWKDHPKLSEVSDRLNAEACNGAASHLNEFIRTLLTKVENNG